ncbi:MAG: hypothetical protein EOO43_24960, partial [Flavobacterium sp.]
MKKILLSLFAIACTLYLSCKKTNSTDGPGEVYGKWKLTETYQDPGDGSGKYRKVMGDAKYLTIEKSGKLQGDALPDLSSFKILDSVQMEVYNNTYNSSTKTF